MSTLIKTEKANAAAVILSAVNKMVDFIAPTFGPAGNKAIIDKQLYRMVVDDGVQIARDFELPDKFENAVVKIIREAAIKTNDRVGDGTTGCLLMVQAIMREFSKKNNTPVYRVALEQELRKAVEEAKTQLLKTSEKISTREDIERVARISFNNDKIAGMIADLLIKIGPDGVIAMDQSNTMDTIAEHTNGLEIKQGYLSPYMTNDPVRALADLSKPHVLVTSYRITNFNDLLGIMNKLVKAGKRELFIIADNVESDALATLIVNRMEGKFMSVAISAPGGEGKEQFLEDVALLTGATLFSEKNGKRLDNAEVSDLGRADRVVVRNNKTTIIGGRGKKETIEKEKTLIRDLLAQNPRDNEKKDLELRLARLANGIAVVKVGAPTENEAKSLKYKVEDAIHATKAAYSGGVVPGAGIALANLKTSSSVLNKALQAPHERFKENMGIEDLNLKSNETYNAITGEKGEAMKVGVIDPTDVMIAQVESAVSIAIQLITSYGLLVEVPEETKE